MHQLNFFSQFENGGDVTAYFMLGRTETRAVLSGHGKVSAQLQKGVVKRWRICRDTLRRHVHSRSGIKFSVLTHKS